MNTISFESCGVRLDVHKPDRDGDVEFLIFDGYNDEIALLYLTSEEALALSETLLRWTSEIGA